ncbi:MAG TPA: hemerythrin domain-containing protein [Burkholderiales bacterium]|nr:hemerythrin domain-containing protein [Burkholderiales bacterium]
MTKAGRKPSRSSVLIPWPVHAWHRDHVRFAQLLDFLEAQMDVFHGGGDPDYNLIRDAVLYLQHYAGRYHHPCEDVAFARLLARDPKMELPINRLLQEHRVIAFAGDQLRKHFDNISGEVVVKRAAVEAAAATYLVYYRHHLAQEETNVLPRAAELLTEEDWSAVVAAIPPGPDPLFGDDVEARFRELRSMIMLDRKPEAHRA